MSRRKPALQALDVATWHKVYLAPATPCDQLLAHDSIGPAIKEKLKTQFARLDPVRLLREMRTAQQTLSEFAAHGVPAEAASAGESDVAVFLASLSSAWKEGEARPTHRKQPKALVEKSGGSVRRRVAANRWMVDFRALGARQRIDGSIGRDVSRSVRKSGTTTNATASGQGVASRARKRTYSGKPAKVR